MTTGCRYCEAHAIRAAERYGSEQDRLNQYLGVQDIFSIYRWERAVFDLAIAASSVPNAVTDEISENMRKHWDDGEIVEILG